ncbi:SDR family oxidoreductase [Rhodoferax sp. 4810]|nr:SDR family oxidoreductase [Rhodoferax jenense]
MHRTVYQLFDLTGKTALITGGSRGLGLQMAYALGEAGARLMLCARGADALEAACADLQAAGLDARWVAADCTLAADRQKLLLETLQRMGDIRILVNNASLSPSAAAPDTCADTAGERLDLTLQGMGSLSKLVATHCMMGSGGRIINLACSASQGAVTRLTRALACEWGQYGVAVNAICPGVFSSPTTQGSLDAEQLAASVPLQRLGHAEDLKGATVLLASDAGSYITGQCLMLDGGTSACLGAAA